MIGYTSDVDDPVGSASPAFQEALALARYVLPAARPLLGPDSALARRIAGDYARALAHHGRPLLSQASPSAQLPGPAALRAWEGLLAPRARRIVVRQHLLLMSAILESQPDLAAHFLPAHRSVLAIAWQLIQLAFGTAAATGLSIGLLAGQRMSRGR